MQTMKSPEQDPIARSPAQWCGLIAGGCVFILMAMMSAPGELSREAWMVAALAVLMFVWWVTEAAPIAVTALLPLIVLPFTGVASLREVGASYMSPVIVLLFAGFILARSIERWGLHERIALFVVDSIGVRPGALIAGFMISAAILSMWISNTATALMMTPIALSVARAASQTDGAASQTDQSPFIAALLLGVAYACSIGGLATPVGSPTNLIAIGYLSDQGLEISFSDWMRMGVPVVLLLLPLSWFVLYRFASVRSDIRARDNELSVRSAIRQARQNLGPVTRPELITFIVFACVAVSWISRSEIQKIPGFGNISDQFIALVGVVAISVLPGFAEKARSAPILDWPSAERIPWGVVLLFGGGLSLAAAANQTGLATFLANYLTAFADLPPLIVTFGVAVMILTLTEFMSNVATVSAMLPVIGALAIATGLDLLLLAAPVAMAASCAFMLPMATGPNAVAYATGELTFARMAKIGVWVNVLSAIVITLVVTGLPG
ncbi:MAG: SLC13/DASS family transporter [Hyphomonadaceae bacterium]|nr:SLC13/DASS family transporter [Hyphomonadaceae bacterium]MBC6412397.1 SLC13/DASS family transporter [Hyphomonadaceae bacterium]